MIYYHKKLNLVCFDVQDIRRIFEAPSRRQLLSEVFKEDSFSQTDYVTFLKDKDKMLKVAGQYSLVNDKEDVEIFTASYMMLTFFSKNSRVCFL